MKRLILTLSFIISYLSFCPAEAQSVTRTRHQAAVTTDAVTKGTLTIRKPDYICISTDGGREQLLMDGTKFTMTTGGKKHVTDSKRNAQFATFQQVLHAVINGQPVPKSDDMTIATKTDCRPSPLHQQAKNAKCSHRLYSSLTPRLLPSFSCV